LRFCLSDLVRMKDTAHAADNDWLWVDWLPPLSAKQPSPPDQPWQEQKKSPKGNLPIADILVLPPKEFDREYTGELTIKRADLAGMKEACKGISLTGCTYRRNDQVCLVYIANNDVLNRHYLSYDAVFRHERAHCLGWHHDNESLRRY
jgi:hypothetical protein